MHSWCAHFVEVRVDEDFGTVRVSRVVSALDSGRLYNPQLAESVSSGLLHRAEFRRGAGIVGGKDQPLGREERDGGGADAELAGERERTPVQFHQLAADGKAEAGAFDLARDHGIAALEGIEHLGQSLFGDPAAGIGHRERQTASNLVQ